MTTSLPKILVVEDDDAFRQTMKETLESLGFHVIATMNGREAQNLIGVYGFDAVITDIRMPELSGIQLLHFIKRNNPIPVILMTGFPEFQDPQEAIDIGATAFLSKPFKKEELQRALAACFKEMKAQLVPAEPGESFPPPKEEVSDAAYCKLDIDDFISGKELLYDIYVRLAKDKYVKIAPQGESLSPERINTYKAKEIKHLYMRKDDFKKYVGFSVNLAKVIKTATSIDKKKKLQFIKHATDVVLTQLQMEGVNEESYENAKTVTESTMSIMTDASELMTLMDMLSKHTNHLYSHSLGVSIHATLIAKCMGWKSPLVLFKLSMGGLLHDIGKKEIPEDILNRPRAHLNPSELKIYQSHTVRGAELLNRLSYIPTDVVQIASQHHENCHGLGFPAGLKGKFIHPLARLVSVANEFCNLAIRGPYSEGMKPEEAIRKMALTFGEALDPVFFNALTKVYKIELEPDSEEADKKRKKFENAR